MLVMDLARCDYLGRNENIIAVGNSGTGKTHIALGLGLAACQKGLPVGFITASALVHQLLEARDEKRLLRLQKQLAKYALLIIDGVADQKTIEDRFPAERIRAAIANRGRVTVRSFLSTLRARIDPCHIQSSL